ncbi:MAG TPA: ABC transporter ATP-binding protein [Ktedonobacterales bacterium]|jgi:putative ABC transport system ATP-binding protein
MNTLIALNDVTKVYDGGAQPGLADVTLRIPSGQFAAIMGPSGSGKSTLLNLIAGLDKPTSGTITVDGVEVGGLGEAALARYRRERLGFVFQFFHLLNQLTVLDNILLPAQLAGMKPSAARARARDLLDQLGIAAKAGAYPARLSGGERQRVAIARALVNRPAVLLADEPTGALDSRTGEQVMEVLAEVHGGGQTVVLVTHDARLAATYAARVVSLRDGHIIDDAMMQSGSGRSISDLMQIDVKEAGK